MSQLTRDVLKIFRERFNRALNSDEKYRKQNLERVAEDLAMVDEKDPHANMLYDEIVAKAGEL